MQHDEELHAAYQRFRALPFPHGTEMVGQLALHDGHVSGLVSSYLKRDGRLDEWRQSLALNLAPVLAELWSGLEEAEAAGEIPSHRLAACREYIRELDQLAQMLMRCVKDQPQGS